MISASVGSGGKNNKADVIYVQNLLNKYLESTASLKPDGLCGKKTINAIIKFQSEVVCLSRPDGRIDIAGNTLKNLEKSRNGYAQIPLAAGVGVKATKVANTPAKKAISPVAKPAVVLTPVSTALTDPRQLKTRQDIANVYGAISADKKWSRQNEFLGSYAVPAAIQSHKDYNWINVYSPKKSKVTSVYCHKAMHRFLDKALQNLVAANQLAKLTEFGGSHCIRATRGTVNWSAHSWALAIDINMTGNELGKVPAMSKEFAQCFIDAGFGWGGNYTRKDGMHFTLAGFDMPRV